MWIGRFSKRSIVGAVSTLSVANTVKAIPVAYALSIHGYELAAMLHNGLDLLLTGAAVVLMLRSAVRFQRRSGQGSRRGEVACALRTEASGLACIVSYQRMNSLACDGGSDAKADIFLFWNCSISPVG